MRSDLSKYIILWCFHEFFSFFQGIINDLARVTHSLDLSSPNVAATVNAVLKPLETLSRIVNQPTGLGPGGQRGGSKNKTGSGGK